METRPSRYYYMIVTGDKYELPVAIYDNARDMAAATGKTVKNLTTGIINAERRHECGAATRYGRPYRYVRTPKEEYELLE